MDLLTLLLILVMLVILVGVFFAIRATVASGKAKNLAAEHGVASETTNQLAVIALVLSFFVSIGGIVCGHIALAQIKRTSERGWGLAVAALWIGYASLVLGLVAGIVVVVLSLSSSF